MYVSTSFSMFLTGRNIYNYIIIIYLRLLFSFSYLYGLRKRRCNGKLGGNTDENKSAAQHGMVLYVGVTQKS